MLLPPEILMSQNLISDEEKGKTKMKAISRFLHFVVRKQNGYHF